MTTDKEDFNRHRILVQETLDTQLQIDRTKLQQLREEAELHFELFKAGLTDEQKAAIEQEAAKRVQPKAAVRRERQLEVYRDEVLRVWFEKARG